VQRACCCTRYVTAADSTPPDLLVLRSISTAALSAHCSASWELLVPDFTPVLERPVCPAPTFQLPHHISNRCPALPLLLIAVLVASSLGGQISSLRQKAPPMPTSLCPTKHSPSTARQSTPHLGC
jgi:hypothetical protein